MKHIKLQNNHFEDHKLPNAQKSPAGLHSRPMHGSFYLYLIFNLDAVVRNRLSAVHNGRPVNNEDANK